MMIVQVASFAKMFIITNLISYVLIKSIAYTDITVKGIVKNEICCVVVAIIYVFMSSFFGTITTLMTCLLLFAFNLKFILRITHFWFAYVISVCMAYTIYILAISLSSFCYLIPGITIESPICLIAIASISFLLAIVLFKVRRFKNGINFVKKFNGKYDTIISVFMMSTIILIVYDILQSDVDVNVLRIALCGTIIVSNIIFATIYKLITKHYKSNMRARTVVIQKEEIDANVKVIEELKKQNLKLSATIHKYNHRLSALESSIRKVMDESNAEFASELSIVLEQTKKVASQFANETKVRIPLPSTNVVSIDNMLEYMRNEAIKSDIDFTLKLSDSIKPLLEKYVPEDKFETLIADHIKDAIIAINTKAEGYKSIMVLIGAVQGAYELSVYDTGVEFDIPTLLKLGTEPVTTHKDNGGSGLGFMTTFETLKYSKASLVIEEYDTSVTNYTKSVTIRFDGKCEYRIYSYRADEIKKSCGSRKILIKKI